MSHRDPQLQEKSSLCHACEERPIRAAGELVSWIEGMTSQRIYCQQCADECAAGLWEGDDDG